MLGHIHWLYSTKLVWNSLKMCADVFVRISLKTVQKDVVWFHVYLISFNLLFNYCYLIDTVPSKRWGVGSVLCTRVTFTLLAPGWVSVAEEGAYLLSLVPLLGLRQILCLGRQVLRLRLLVVVRLLALLAVATYTLLTILRWDLLEEPSKANAWVEAEGHEIKLCPIRMATSAEVISSATHLTQWSDSFTQQLLWALRSSCLSRRSEPKCFAQSLFLGRASKENATLPNITIL